MDTVSRTPADNAVECEATTGTAGYAASAERQGSSMETVRLGIIGLGYVGLPLAVEFGKRYATLGFDINPRRVEELRAGSDATLEVDRDELAGSPKLRFSSTADDLAACDVYIVTVPTPIDD